MPLIKKLHLKRALELNKKLKSSGKTAKTLCEELNFPYTETESRKIRKWLMSQDSSNFNPGGPTGEIFKKAQARKVVKSKYFLITSAQNATPVNKELLKNMEAYAKHLKGEIEVIPIRYRNPTVAGEGSKDDYWHDDVLPYLIASRHSLNKNLTVLADVKTQPTASMPLSGMEGLTGVESSIIGHPRQHLNTLPTLEGYPKKVMLSTGSITNENYSASKSGAKGAFHHTYGFVIVEIKSDTTFYIRHVSAQRNGTFYDLDTKVENGVVSVKQDNVEAIVCGDLHLGDHCDVAIKCTYEMLERFNPRNVVLHDILNGHSISHHEKKNPFKKLEREQDGTDQIEEELELSMKFLESVVKYSPVIPAANHNDFLDRWLLDSDWRKENNKYTYLKYAKLKADGKLPKGILAYEIQKKFGSKVLCLDEQGSFRVRGVELGQHGHLGAGGSRGSFGQFKRHNTKIVTGHSHTPLKFDGFTSVGTLTKLRLEYNKGLSSWMNSNVIVHKNGKTQNLLIISGKYTTL